MVWKMFTQTVPRMPPKKTLTVTTSATMAQPSR